MDSPDKNMRTGLWIIVGCIGALLIPGLLFNAEYKRLNAEKLAREARDGINPVE